MLGVKGRRVLLSVHLLLNSIWIGGLVAILLANSLKEGISNGDHLYAMNRTIFKIHDTVLINTAFGVITTGFLFSLFTKWGFFKFHWVTIKWLSIAILFLLITFYMGPSINGIAAISDVERSQALTNPLYLQYERESTIFTWIQLVILSFVIVTSVFKPWGQRKRQFNVNRKTVLTIGGILGLLLISMAFVQYIQLQTYRKMPIENIDLSLVPSGTYKGEARYGFNYVVEVIIENQKIKHIEIVENRKSIYAKLAEGVTRKVIKAQSPNVDAVTGATTTSKCLMKAIEDAIERGLKQ
ncbi:MAG: FMN-binding protein [bacterium]